MTGTLIVVDPGRTACLECIYPDEPPFEERFPVLGAISSALGSLAALEAIKIGRDFLSTSLCLSYAAVWLRAL